MWQWGRLSKPDAIIGLIIGIVLFGLMIPMFPLTEPGTWLFYGALVAMISVTLWNAFAEPGRAARTWTAATPQDRRRLERVLEFRARQRWLTLMALLIAAMWLWSGMLGGKEVIGEPFFWVFGLVAAWMIADCVHQVLALRRQIQALTRRPDPPPPRQQDS